MTSANPSPDAANPATGLRVEVSATLKLALPLVFAQFALMTMGHVDVAVIGRYSGEALAGVSLGDSLAYGVMVFGMGFPLALEPLTAKALGAGDPDRAWLLWQQGLRLAFLIGIPLALAALVVVYATPWMGVDDVTAESAQRYLVARAPAMMVYLAYNAARSFLQSHQRLRAIVVAALVANAVNFVASVLLVHGDVALVSMGLPAIGFEGLGEVGAGFATSLSTLLMVAILLWDTRKLRPNDIRPLSKLDTREPRRAILRMGGPLTLQTAAEYTVFSMVGILAAVIGRDAISAHRIALLISTTTFMCALGIGSAAASRVGRATGEGDYEKARRAGTSAIVIMGVFMAVSTVCFIAFAEPLTRLFAPSVPTVIALGSTLVVVAGVFQLVDGLQVVAQGALRGLGDVKVPFLLTISAHWGVGFTLGTVLAFSFDMGVIGLWVGLTAGLAVASVTLTIRFYHLMRVASDATPTPTVATETHPL